MWKQLFPPFKDPLEQGHARLVIASCLGLMVSAVAVILVWLISGDLQGETVIAGLIFALILFAMVMLVHRRHVKGAAWSLVGFLMLLITLDVAGFGLGSISGAAYFLPIALAGCVLGPRGSMSVSGVASLIIWGVALAGQNKWYEPVIPFEIFQLTFNAPVLTVLFLLVGLMIGSWTQYMTKVLRGEVAEKTAEAV
jgi:hypothetical protein